MGTSKSSAGPKSGTNLIPTWTPEPPDDDENEEQPTDPDTPDDENEEQPTDPDTPDDENEEQSTSLSHRFMGARRHLGYFAQTGSLGHMQQGIRYYIRKGYGGVNVATRRMESVARTAERLHDILSSVESHSELEGLSVNEIIDKMVEIARSTDGTQDAEVERKAIRDTLSDLSNQFSDSDIDFFNLSEKQRVFVIERFLASSVYNRLALDVGKHIQDKAPSATDALARFKEIKDYVKEGVSACFRKLHRANERIGVESVSKTARRALKDTFIIFEGYIQ